MNSFIRTLISICLLLTVATVVFADDATRQDKILRLLELQHMPEDFGEMREQSVWEAEQAGNQMFDQLRQSFDDELFQEYFDQIEPLMDQYVEACMPTWTTEEVIERYAVLFGAEISESDVDLLIESMATPEAQRVIEATRKATRILMKEITGRQQKQVRMAVEEFTASLQRLLRQGAGNAAGGAAQD